MKTFGILLALCVSIVQTSLNATELIELINDVRKDVAQKYRFANMHELVYDAEIGKEIEKFSCSNLQDFHREDVSFLLAPVGDDVRVEINRELEHLTNITKWYRDDRITERLGLVMPSQTKIACKVFSPPCRGGPPARFKMTTLCGVGPRPVEKINKKQYDQDIFRKTFAEEEVLKGEPGTKCPHGKTASRLCKPGAKC